MTGNDLGGREFRVLSFTPANQDTTRTAAEREVLKLFRSIRNAERALYLLRVAFTEENPIDVSGISLRLQVLASGAKRTFWAPADTRGDGYRILSGERFDSAAALQRRAVQHLGDRCAADPVIVEALPHKYQPEYTEYFVRRGRYRVQCSEIPDWMAESWTDDGKVGA